MLVLAIPTFIPFIRNGFFTCNTVLCILAIRGSNNYNKNIIMVPIIIIHVYIIINHQYIKILVVCPCVCVTDVGVAITNLRVVCKIITCVSASTEMAILLIFCINPGEVYTTSVRLSCN